MHIFGSNTRRGGFFALLACGGFFGAAHDAQAQLIQQYFPSDVPGYAPDFSSSVTQRIAAQGGAQGVEVGDFIIRPQVSENFGYNSDVLGRPGSGSPVLSTGASVGIASDWDRDSLGASFSVSNNSYLDLPVADYRNWAASVGGSLQLGNDSLTVSYSHQALHLNAEDLGDLGVTTPVPYHVDDVRLSFGHAVGRFSFTPSFDYQNIIFGQSAGANTVNYDGLNHQLETERLASEYEFSPGDAAVLVLRSTQAQYAITPASGYLDYAVFAGLDFRADSVIQFRTLAGVETRSFQANSQSRVTSPTFEVDGVWTPSEIDTVTATGVRQQQDPTTPFASSEIITNGSVMLDHELRQNVFLHANIGAGLSTSPTSTASETQYSAGASARWNVNRHMRASLNYGFSHGQSSGGVAPTTDTTATGFSSYTSNSITLGISFFE